MPSLRTVNNRRKERKRVKARRWLRAVGRALAISLGCPSRPWFRLQLRGDVSRADGWE